MPLVRVTLTGVDDETDIDSLIALADKYPFVEYGILLGEKAGPRMPSITWINALHNEAELAKIELKTSLHICGVTAQLVTLGEEVVFHRTGRHFQRVQLNLNRIWHHSFDDVGSIVSLNIATSLAKTREKMIGRHWNPAIIFQVDHKNKMPISHETDRSFSTQFLFDASCGKGVLPAAWQNVWNDERVRYGYAGGLNPENLPFELQLIEIAADGSRYWVDMETGVRDENNRFDMDLADRALNVCGKFMRYLDEKQCRLQDHQK